MGRTDQIAAALSRGCLLVCCVRRQLNRHILSFKIGHHDVSQRHGLCIIAIIPIIVVTTGFILYDQITVAMFSHFQSCRYDADRMRTPGGGEINASGSNRGRCVPRHLSTPRRHRHVRMILTSCGSRIVAHHVGRKREQRVLQTQLGVLWIYQQKYTSSLLFPDAV